jgi:hypothetical protein
MNKIIKHILAGLTVMAITVTAFAQQYAPQTLWSTNVILPSTAAAINAVYSLTDYEQIAIVASCVVSNDGTVVQGAAPTIRLAWNYSLDGTIYTETNFITTIVMRTNDAWATQTIFTNMDVGAWGYIKFMYLTNGATACITTNNLLKVATKARRREYR